jgi:predicted small integral membrane protein
MFVRLSKMLAVAAMALFATIVTFNNLTDYDSNFQFVERVFMMDTTFPGNALLYRAIDAPLLHHAGYLIIIALEAGTAILCWWGAYRMFKARTLEHHAFQRAKKIAVAGLTLGFLTWQVVFMTIGGEWFAMWMSEDWNGVPSAFRFFVTLLLVLIYLTLHNDDLDVVVEVVDADHHASRSHGERGVKSESVDRRQH